LVSDCPSHINISSGEIALAANGRWLSQGRRSLHNDICNGGRIEEVVLEMLTTTTGGARTSGVIPKTVVVSSDGTFPLNTAMPLHGVAFGFFQGVPP
jgi:hypothetical protein